MNTLVESLYCYKFLLEFSPLGVLKLNFEGCGFLVDEESSKEAESYLFPH